MKEFNVNDYLTLKLEDGKTIIYVKGERFIQCMFLLLEIPIKEITSLDDIESIDEAKEKLDSSLEGSRGQHRAITPETEFWGHCSNLQAWYEYDYDTRLLHSNLAFPLLKRLTKVGDPLANKVFKEEIAKRFQSGYIPSIYYLIKQGYLEYINDNEIELVFLENNPKLRRQLESNENNKKMAYYITLNLFDKGDLKAKEILQINESKIILSRLDLKRIPKIIWSFKNLEVLFLDNNQLTELPESIGNLTSLQVLYLVSNELTKLPEAIGKLRSLQELHFYSNKLTELPEAIGKLRSLQRLDLRYNKLTELPEAIGNLTSLQWIRLSDNKLKKLPEAICNLTSLQKLDLLRNQLTSLPESIGKLTSLQWLSLSNNKLKKLPEAIGNLTSLQKLNLGSNNLKKLPEAIGKLISLKILYLSENKLRKLPETIGNLTSLQKLYLKPNPLINDPDSKTKDILERLEKNGVKIII